MRALRLALVAALISVSVVESSNVFARSAGGNGPGAAAGGTAGGTSGGTSGGSSGGTSGGTSGGGSGGHGGLSSTLSVDAVVLPQRRPRVVLAPVNTRDNGPCFKQQHFYDRFGDPVFNIYGAECFGD